jgi:hypothetical protein
MRNFLEIDAVSAGRSSVVRGGFDVMERDA